jgi:hypothetical protein
MPEKPEVPVVEGKHMNVTAEGSFDFDRKKIVFKVSPAPIDSVGHVLLDGKGTLTFEISDDKAFAAAVYLQEDERRARLELPSQADEKAANDKAAAFDRAAAAAEASQAAQAKAAQDAQAEAFRKIVSDELAKQKVAAK